MNIVEIGKTILKNLDKAAIVILLVLCAFLWFKTISMEQQAQDATTDHNNRMAEMSKVVQENQETWSRLAQERSDSFQRLNEILPELAETIRQRDEQIMALTRATASIRPIVVRVVQGSGAEQSEEPGETPEAPARARVTFDSTYQEFARIHGFTLTNPAEANVSVEFVRPINFVVTTTQAEDESWRTYIQSDLPGLEIGQIESQVTPIVRRRGWEHDIEVGIFGAAAVTGNAGIFGAEVGYDFGSITVGVNAGGITYTGSTDFLVGGRVTIAPFDL
jgi:hypothetical protein